MSKVIKIPRYQDDFLDLWSPHNFQFWLAHAREERSISDIANSLWCIDTDISRCRAACTAFYGDEMELWNVYTDELLNSTSRLIEYHIRAFKLFWNIYIAMGSGQNSAYSGAVETLPLFDYMREELAKESPSAYRREIECDLGIANANALLMVGDYKGAERIAAEALFWARELKAPFSLQRAKTQLLGARMRLGAVSATIQLLRDPNDALEDDIRTYRTKSTHESFLAYSLAHLGAHKEALEVMMKIDVNANDYMRFARVYRQQITYMMGMGDTEAPVIGIYRTIEDKGIWFSQALQALVKVHSLPQKGKALKARSLHLDSVITRCKDEAEPISTWHDHWRVWMMATAYYWKGQSTVALNLVNDYCLDSSEWLDIHILMAGLKLEIALDIIMYDYSIDKHEAKILEILEQARQKEFGSPGGLATLLARWFPHAAAYLNQAPKPTPELDEAAASILDNYSYQVYDLKLPPVMAAEFTLRGLNLDLHRNVKSVDSGKRRTVRDALEIDYGGARYHRPVVSPVKLIYGLTKVGTVEYAKAAKNVYLRYGAVPTTSADHSMRHLTEAIDNATKLLLEKSISHQEFSEMILEA